MKDAPHTKFYADNDIYHYTVIPFGLINVDATYKIIVTKMSVDMVGNTR